MTSGIRLISIFIIYVGLCLFTLQIVNAQGFSGGIHTGFSASQVSGDTKGGYNKAGLFLGLTTGLSINEKASWQFEINYFEKGSRDAKVYPVFSIKVNYVDLSTLIKYKYSDKITSFGLLIEISFAV